MSTQQNGEGISERENLVLDRFNISSGAEFSSELQTVVPERADRADLETSTSAYRSVLIATIVVLCFACLIVGIALLVTAFASCKNVEEKSTTATLKTNNICKPSLEAERVRLFEFFTKVQRDYFKLHPHAIIFDQTADLATIKKVFQAYDSTPVAVKQRNDVSLELLDQLVKLNVQTSKLKPRESKLFSQMKFYLEHAFGQPYDGYYTGAWLMGPNVFCWHPICSLGGELARHLPLFAPETVDDIKRLRLLFQGYNKTIYQYITNLKNGVSAGMVRSIEECKAGLNAFKEAYKQIDRSNESGVLEQEFALVVSKPKFYSKLLNNTDERWRTLTGKSVMDTIHDLTIMNVGLPIKHLLRYLENDYMRHCVPSNVSSGLANRPLSHVYTDGIPTTPTAQSLPTGERLYGDKTYDSIMSFFTTTDVTPRQVHDMGWKNVHGFYKQMVAIAKQVTGLNNTSAAIKQFRAMLKSQSMYFNDEPLPKNESGREAYRKCGSVEGAMKYCPMRWKAIQKWFKTSKELMSMLDPLTIDMFYFTGEKHTTPNCPVQLVPDFNPSSAAQSYMETGPVCRTPCYYRVPFFLENLGPKFSEWSTNAHEARPGHHTQSQGYQEHFRDSCGGVASWMNNIMWFPAFAEGWGLYAENLIGRDTNAYEGKPLMKFGWLKWQMWRSLRLVIDTGLHYQGMTRQEALNLFDRYAWDDSDIPAKEVTRYQSGPGQATAYLVGELTLSRLRREAEEKLGDRFDLKDFHFQVLSQGSAPLSFLIGHFNHYVTCKWNMTADPVCRSILNPPSSAQPSKDVYYRKFNDETVDLTRYFVKRYA